MLVSRRGADQCLQHCETGPVKVAEGEDSIGIDDTMERNDPKSDQIRRQDQ